MQRIERVHVFFTGSFFPGLETALARAIGDFKRENGPLAPLTILVPTNLLRVYLPRRLAECFGGHANLRFQTLADLVRLLVPPEILTLPPLAPDLIMAGVIKECVPPDSYFGPVCQGLGFRSALLSAIHDLKQAGISPASLRDASHSLDKRKFHQLADLYEAYEKRLAENRFMDEDDLLKCATQSASSTPRVPGPNLFIYGFYDFNHLQRQLIEALVKRAATLVFMPYHPSEAFRYAEPTRAWFEQILSVEAEQCAETDGVQLPVTLENLRSRLFLGRGIEPGGEPEAACFSILSAPGEARETREILREAVRFAGERKRPLLDSAVIARYAEEYAEPLRDCARSRGYQIHLHGGRSMLRYPVAQAVLLLPQIVEESYGRRTVLEFLSLAPIRLERVLPVKLRPGFLPSLWGEISAEAGIVAGTEAWEKRVARWIRAEIRRLARAAHKGETLPATANTRLLAAKALEKFLKIFFAAIDGLAAGEAKWSEFVGIVEDVARRFLSPSQELEETLQAIRTLRALETFRTRVTLSEFTEFVRQVLSSAQLRESSFEEGGLFVGGLESCRGVSWPMVILPGLVESSFPRVVREDPILLDEERKAINRTLPGFAVQATRSKRGKESSTTGVYGIDPLPLKQAGHDEERLLFQLAVESARERLVLTYPRLNPFDGSARVPSIFLLHTLEALRGGTANFSTLARDPLHRFMPIGGIREQTRETILDSSEYDTAIIHTMLGKGVRFLKPYLDEVSPWIAKGLHCERRRWSTPFFTEFDGVFYSNEAKRGLARWVKGRSWSVTSLERFVRSPYEFYLTQLLGIEPVENPEEAEVVSPQNLGTLWHDILRDVVGRLCEEKAWPRWTEDRTRQLDLACQVAEQHFAEFETEGVTGYPILWEVCREKILAVLRTWLLNEPADNFIPCHVEYALTPTKVLGVTIQGRVDRIDCSATGDQWRVYDYKTGRKPFKDESFNKGLALQIPLYMLALETKLEPPVEVKDGFYFYITHHGELKRVGWRRDKLRRREPYLQMLLKEILDCIREGRFFVTGRVPDIVGVTMSKAALEKLMELKQEDLQWKQFHSILEAEEASRDESEWVQLPLLPAKETE